MSVTSVSDSNVASGSSSPPQFPTFSSPLSSPLAVPAQLRPKRCVITMQPPHLEETEGRTDADVVMVGPSDRLTCYGGIIPAHRARVA